NVIEDEAMNAFAAGRDPKHSVVAATRGLLDSLNREELQAVIGHEMGHIRNFDIRFAMLIAVMVGVIGIMSHLFLRGMRFGGGRSRGSGRGKGNAAQAVFILIGIVLAIIAPILATIIQMAVSRQREFMADSSSVEFTRNPRGLISALTKLASSPVKMEGAVKATQHMFIVNPFKNFGERSSNLFSTHPPIESRIKVLESMVV
ncbi:MAG: M48 family metallopeptidase, partial [Deltaproteobacteria bacterium]|nr:M48 family metallopeptidase [Deltaproteobacteria bacterium]